VRERKVEFRVMWEIEIHADSPEEAAEQARALQLDPVMPATVFEVWDHTKQKMHRIDLAAPGGRLNNGELGSLRTTLRQLQCAPDLAGDTKDILSVMLMFLDAEEGHSRRRLNYRSLAHVYNRAP
jgi:hypothetical protein